MVVLAFALTGACAGPASERKESADGRRDLLHDVADDGSLITGLGDPDPQRRWLAARGLARLPAMEDPSPLVTALASEADPVVQAALCLALGRWKAAGAREPLRRATSHPDPGVRVAALDALSRLEDDRLTPVFVESLSDSRASVRGAAALALARADGKRHGHERLATASMLASRDAALAEVVNDDPDPGVRWRAAYALASVPPRPDHVSPLIGALTEPDEPLVRVFALRGLQALAEAGLVSGARETAFALLADPDPRVGIEAARLITALTDDVSGYAQLTALLEGDHSPATRLVVWNGLAQARARARVEAGAAPDAKASFDALDERIRAQAEAEPSEWVRREAKVAVISLRDAAERALAEAGVDGGPEPESERGRTDLAGRTLLELARSLERRDREAAAALLAEGSVRDDEVLTELLSDDEPTVVAAALPALSDERLASLWSYLRDALQSDDPALIGMAAAASRPIVLEGRAPPWLVSAVAEATGRADADYTLEESRIELARALGLPPLDPVPPTETPAGSLLDRLEALHDKALEDPTPRIELQTARGPVILELDRVRAPRHVESALELVASGAYDGLTFHRVVPGFVVQGLDPRGDGWGVGGRRLPDEFSGAPFLTGSLGMPRVARPHTGGCQMFITQLPTPHLDGEYTVFGRVVEGQEVIDALEVGDRVVAARRLDG